MSSDRETQADLKRREYRDEEGNIHHHTHPYMEQHGGRSGHNTADDRGGSAESRRSHDGSGSRSGGATRESGESHGASAHPLIDHDEIREWAEARGAKPSCVRGTGGKGDPGLIRLDFPGFSGGDRLEEISWDEWFQSFDDNNLALLVQDRTAAGEQSNFNKLVARATAEGKQSSRREGHH